MNSKMGTAVACLLLTNVIWAGNALIARHAGGSDMQPLTMNYLRWLMGALILLPFCGREIWQRCCFLSMDGLRQWRRKTV